MKQSRTSGNSPAWLAKRAAKALGVPFLQTLRCRSDRTDQKSLTAAQRAEHARGRYSLCRPVDLAGKRLILIDDICTTGATTDACALLLKKQGADRITVCTVGKT